MSAMQRMPIKAERLKMRVFDGSKAQVEGFAWIRNRSPYIYRLLCIKQWNRRWMRF